MRGLLDYPPMYRRFNEERATGQCPICDQPAIAGLSVRRNAHEFICGRCGAFRVSEEFIWELPSPGNPLYEFRYRIGSLFRIASERIADVKDLPVHPKSDVLATLNTSDPIVDEKLGLLLSFLARQAVGPGKFTTFDEVNDYCVVYARDSDEGRFLVESLVSQRLIEWDRDNVASYRLTAAGWSELNRRERAGAESNDAFIAMSFSSDWASTGEAIALAVRSAGYRPIRMDQVEHSNRIDDEILARLRSSKFLVVDLTGQNPGAYFEAGFMLGLGRQVIWTCSREELANIHFDARQYNIIDYGDDEDLRKRLQFRIEAIIGKGAS